MNCKGLKAAVLGLGVSGRAAVELLLEKGADVVALDHKWSEALETLAAGLKARGARVELGAKSQAVCRFDLGVISPGIRPDAPMVEQVRQTGATMMGELEFAYRFCECPIIAITGTNGKSTTTELVAAVLTADGKKTTACGNIGKALSSVVNTTGELDVVTVEVSSFQLETIIEFRPRVAVYLNFAPDHLDSYKSVKEYWEAKARLFLNQTPDDYAVVNSGCRYPMLRAKQITFNAMGGDADYTSRDGALMRGDEILLHQEKTKLKGPHNAENQLAAFAVGDLYAIPRPRIVEALCEYQPLPHRCETARVLDGVTYINDSKATNIDAMEKALLAQSQPVVLIAGGKDKGFDFSTVGDLVKKKTRHAVLLGETQSKIFQAWERQTNCHRVESMAEAVALSRKLARSGDVVLFSPGCSSYDMFKNFEERGDVFKTLVKELKSL
ncbi:MAG: UDP-N-acetylmuramoyl-L-alanine--D-glutamate ligase [bacterium]